MTTGRNGRVGYMSSGKPSGESWESFVDRQIREAQQRGEFDNLSGAGKPIPDLHQPRDESWWLRKKLKDENFTSLPPALQLRKDLEKARERIAFARSEREVRTILTLINEHIRYTNRTIVHGPPSTVMPLDEEKIVHDWRRHQRSEDR